jgi:soluble lytic murein transglycosylase-like protein
MRFAVPLLLPVWALLLTWPLACRADVYFFEATDGSTHYSDSATDPRYQLLIADSTAAVDHTPPPTTDKQVVRSFEREIASVAQATQVDAELLHAVIAVESRYNPRAISPKGALGLMQLMPATARAYGIKNPFDALQNIQGGARHLRRLLDHFANNKSLALAAYNAGLGAVLTYGGQIPPFAETRSYVPEVLRRYAANRKLVSNLGEPVSGY